MGKKERGLIIFEDFFEIASALTNDSEFRRVIEAMYEYNRDGTVPNFVGAMKAVFLCAKMAIDRNSEKWEKKLKQCSNAGKKGGRPRNRKDSGDKNDRLKNKRPLTDDKKINDRLKNKRPLTDDKKNNEQQRPLTKKAISTSTSTSISTSNSMSTTLLSESVDVITPSYISPIAAAGQEGKTLKRSKLTRKKTMADLRSLYPEACGFWDRIRKVYPSPRRHEPAEGTLQIIEAEKLWEQEEAITKSIIAWSNCDEWKRGYALRMSRFIEEGYYKNDPPAPKGPEVIHRIISTHAPKDECTEDTDIPTL